MTSDSISSKFKELNSIVAQMISSLREDSDQNAFNEERSEEIIKNFSLISNDMKRMLSSINEVLEESHQEQNNLPSQEIILNREEVKIISDQMKKEIENINKEVQMQEKNISLIKENINKIMNN